jgi:hypothetical protein
MFSVPLSPADWFRPVFGELHDGPASPGCAFMGHSGAFSQSANRRETGEYRDCQPVLIVAQGRGIPCKQARGINDVD